ncbi:MAG: ADP compounds hydrolase NudE [Pseudomonadota bacterium]
MKLKPIVVESEIAASTSQFKVERRRLRFSTGFEHTFERLLDGDLRSVVVVPMLSDDRFILINEYAAGVNDYVFSLPMGTVKPGEDLLVAADRELREEIGYGARELTHLRKLTLVPSHLQHTVDVVVARDLFPASAEGDEPEHIDCHTHSLTDIFELATQKEFREARTIAALYLARDWLTARG